MKKFYVFVVAVTMFLLVGCGKTNEATTSTTQSSSSEKVEGAAVKITVKAEDTSKEFSKVIKEKEALTKVLDDTVPYKLEKGFLVSINNIEQDSKNKLYWGFKVNGTVASEGVETTMISPKDHVEFYLQKFE
ncbi:MAG: DUF4430 domain-containing protein [Lactobacillales bacterium]|jgi:ABC-type enterochelin transport system substrate-binding protein|nr:DUF4430 domain-containing protein [Lactobacillales bacterium]